MEMNLPNPKAVLANEVFAKGSPRSDFLSTLNRPRHTLSSLDDLKNCGKTSVNIILKRGFRNDKV
jgi:hypothetical protein